MTPSEDDEGSVIELAGKHRLLVERNADASALHLVGADGRITLTISVSPAGAVLRLDGHVAIEVSGTLDFAAQRVDIRAREGIALQTDGELELRAKGEITVEAEDAVSIAGTQLLLNC